MKWYLEKNVLGRDVTNDVIKMICDAIFMVFLVATLAAFEASEDMT